MQRMEAGSRLVVLDFTQLDYVSSAGLRTLLGLIKTMKELDGKLCVVFGEGMVKEVITMSGFDHFLDSYASVADALEA
jgi:anti-anti-sigma factor